jgi:hypothetical protein
MAALVNPDERAKMQRDIMDALLLSLSSAVATRMAYICDERSDEDE